MPVLPLTVVRDEHKNGEAHTGSAVLLPQPAPSPDQEAQWPEHNAGARAGQQQPLSQEWRAWPGLWV